MPGVLRHRLIAVAKLFQLRLLHFFHVHQGIMRALRGADQFVQLRLDRSGITVLGVLDREDHQKGDDGGAGIGYQLPGFRKPDDWPLISQSAIKPTARRNVDCHPVHRETAFAMAPNLSNIDFPSPSAPCAWGIYNRPAPSHVSLHVSAPV